MDTDLATPKVSTETTGYKDQETITINLTYIIKEYDYRMMTPTLRVLLDLKTRINLKLGGVFDYVSCRVRSTQEYFLNYWPVLDTKRQGFLLADVDKSVEWMGQL